MGLNKSIFRHTAIYSIASIMGKLAGFILLPFYAHIFKTEGYGIIGMLDASLGVFAIVFGYGLSTAIIRIFHEQDNTRKGYAISTAIWLVWALSFILFPLPILFSRSISALILGDASHYVLFCLAIVTFILDISGQSASTYLIIRQRSIFYSVVGLLRMFVQIGLNIWLVIILETGLIGFFISSLITAILIFLIFTIKVIKNYGLKYDKEIAIKLIRFQLPLLPGEFISFLSRQVERFFVRFVINIQNVGILEMAYKFPPLLGHLFSEPFHRAWTTKSIEIAETDDNAPHIVGSMLTKYLYILIFLGLVMAVNIENILIILTPPEFWQASRIAKIEIVTTIFIGARTYLLFGLIFKKLTGTISIIRTTTAIVKIILSFLFIYYWGIVGAAYSALIMEIVMVIWVTLKSQQAYPIAIEYRNVAIIALTGLSLFYLTVEINIAKFHLIPFITEQSYISFISNLDTTFLGKVGSGKVINLLLNKDKEVIGIFYNSLAAILFLTLIPVRYLIYKKRLSYNL